MYKYNAYLPLYLREIREFMNLGNAADPPAVQTYQYTVQKYLNQSVQTADAATLSRWEGIFRMNGAGLEMEERRKRILIKFRLRSPITVKSMEEMITEILGVSCAIALDFPKYHMDVKLFQVDPSVDLNFLYSEIFLLKPANITLKLQDIVERKQKTPLYTGAVQAITTKTLIAPRSAIGSRRTGEIKAGFCPVQYTRLFIRPYDGATVRRQNTPLVAACGRAEITQIKIPAYRRDI